MGSFFSNILVENTGTMNEVKRAVTQGFRELGYTPTDDQDDADAVVFVYGTPSDRFLTLVGDFSEDEDGEPLCELAFQQR